MRKVYICSPYRAKDGAELDRNIDYAQQLTRQALEAGLAPITPHLYMTQCMDDKKPEERARGMAAWHFPCVIEKDSTKSMIYGYRAESVIVDCYNEGDVSTGMRIRFTALGTVSNPILLNVDTEEFIQINATMKTGDVIEINTKYGSKGAKLIRDGVETDYFRYIDVDSTFMQLAIGDNMFKYDAASGVNSLEVSIFYSKEFLGV